ncbi:MAG: hypothetical protein F4X56_05860 [Gammaproteobacteria bacterium]|nr:hypothetical protein [Gammaproteobacteria bacterium]MYC25428.1 hypothetical protein [Gammaproteobacteria bacterium]
MNDIKQWSGVTFREYEAHKQYIDKHFATKIEVANIQTEIANVKTDIANAKSSVKSLLLVCAGAVIGFLPSILTVIIHLFPNLLKAG